MYFPAADCNNYVRVCWGERMSARGMFDHCCDCIARLAVPLLATIFWPIGGTPQFFWPGVLFQVCVGLFALFLLLLGVVTPACHYTIKVFWEFNKTAWPGVQAGRKRVKKTGNPILQFQKVSIIHMYIHILVVVQTLTFFQYFSIKGTNQSCTVYWKHFYLHCKPLVPICKQVDSLLQMVATWSKGSHRSFGFGSLTQKKLLFWLWWWGSMC